MRKLNIGKQTIKIKAVRNVVTDEEQENEELVEKISDPRPPIFPMFKKKEKQYVIFISNKDGTYTPVGRFESDMKSSRLLKEFRAYIAQRKIEEIEKLLNKTGFGL